MQAISDAMGRLFEDGSWFVRARELSLLVVRASQDLRKTTLQMLAGLEFHHDNRSAWVILEDAHTHADASWQVRANRLLANWEARREAFRKNEGIEMPAAQPAPRRSSSAQRSRPTLSFQEAGAAVLRALQAPLEGLVLVMAPAMVEELDAFGAEFEALIADPALRQCRWVWLLDETAPWPSLLKRLGTRAIQCDCVPDPEKQKGDLATLVSSPPASFGCAAPRGVTLPKRVDAPPPLDTKQRDAMLRQAGIEPEYLEKTPHLRPLVLGAALAMKDKDGVRAVRLQREACQLAMSLKLLDVTVICQVALASYLSGLGQREAALSELRAAVKLAQGHGLGLQEAQARLAMALLLALDRRYPEAVREYQECASHAEEANVPLLAIEAWRLAGQLSLQQKQEAQAASCFREAIRVAAGATPETVKLSSASEVARRLASLCKDRGLQAQAESLFKQADAMERGEIGTQAGARV
jgi:tetratricopeptide (TPR) repeat protein